MLKRLKEILTSIPATIIGGIFLVASFVLSKLSVDLPADPAWITVLICGLPLLYSAVRKLLTNHGVKKISTPLLISIAMIAAIAIGDLFAAAEVAFLMAVGEILEDLTTDRAKKGLKKLISLAPTQGRKLENGKEVMISATEITVGDILRILPGETIPVDGCLLTGETSVDQSALTGESMPVDKAVGDEVFSGTVNRFGVIEIKATKVGKDSSLQKLIRMVQEAEEKKAPMQRTADKSAGWLVPAALLIAVITYLVTGDIVRAVTVLVVFCPCALVLATPTAIMAAIGQATKHGVIIKSGEALETMGKVTTIAFDKTGTLTYGKPEVSDIISLTDSLSETDLLALVASAESKSEHPLGKAIVAHAKKNNLALTESTAFTMTGGKGIRATVSGHDLICGTESFLKENGILISAATKERLEQLRSQGKVSVLIGTSDSCIGILALSDVLRPEAAGMIKKLHSMQTKAVLLTGDNQKTAEYFAKQAGISELHGGLLPEEKVAHINELSKQGNTVCMIGDGINDAPALKSANVGVAMGTMGSDIAVEASDIALMGDDISKIPYLKRLSNATVKTIKFSIALSMLINILAVVLSVLGLLNPTTGALVHNAGSVFVILIATLLYDRKFEDK